MAYRIFGPNFELSDSLRWAKGVSSPTLDQEDNTTASATGQALTIRAQNATGTTATGGALTLTSGTGTTVAGAVLIQAGGSTKLTVNASGVVTVANLSTGVVHSDSSGNLTSSAVNLAGADVTGTLPTGNQASQSMGGDVSGTTASATVIKINGTSVPATPSANRVLVATSGTTSIWSQIVDGYVAASAAIAGTKISPDFGSQNVTTTGSITGSGFVGNSLDRSGSGALSLGTANATSISIGGASIPTTINGNLIVNGTTTTVNSTVVDIADRVIHVNHSAGVVPVPSSITGYSIHRGSPDGVNDRDHVGLFWDEANSIFKLAYNTTGDDSALGTNLAVAALSATLSGMTTGRVVTTSTGGLLVDTAVLSVSNLPSLAGDVSGTIDANTVDKLKGKSLNAALSTIGSPQDGYILTWVNGSSDWEAKPNAGGSGAFVAGGDLTGTNTSQTVAKINSATVPAAGSLTTGNVLQVSGSSALTYAAVNLAGGANYVTGTLPTGNQAAQTMAGDVTGTTAASSVVKIQGKSLNSSLSTIGAAEDGYVLSWVNGSSDWEAKPATAYGTGVLTFLTTPTSANLVAAITDETGSGALVFGTSPTISGAVFSGTPSITATSVSQTVGSLGTIYDDVSQTITTDATVTSAFTWTIQDEAMTLVDIVVTACRTTGATGAVYKRTAAFRRTGGTVTVSLAAQDNLTYEDVSAWDCTIDNSTSTGRIRITGAASTTINWHVACRRQVSKAV